MKKPANWNTLIDSFYLIGPDPKQLEENLYKLRSAKLDEKLSFFEKTI